MDCFALLLVSSTAYFLVASASVPLRVVTSGLFRGKKTSKTGTFDAIIVKQKRMSVTKPIYVFQRILLRSSLFKYVFSGNKWTHFIESSHQWFFRDKRNIFEAIILKQKQRSTTEEIHVFLILLECLYVVKLYIFWKRVHAFNWK